MEKPEVTVYVKSGGRRIALYAELGGYFSPDGTLNESVFRAFIRQSLRSRMGEAQSKDEATDWLSSYLENVLAYLDERAMGSAALQLFEAAVDESAKLGVERLTVAPEWMRRLLSAAANQEASPNRKHAPDEKKQRIFDCALAVFTERGFHQVTMDEIAAAAGVAKGTVYRYFKSKEDLLDQLLMATSRKIVGRFSGSFTGERNVLEEIQRFVEQWVGFIEENHVLYRLNQAEGITPQSGRQTVFYEYLIANFPMAKERLASLNADGNLKTVSFSTAVYGLLGFIDGVVIKWLRSGMDYPLRDEIPMILEILFYGFARERDPHKAFFVPPEEHDSTAKALQSGDSIPKRQRPFPRKENE